MKRIAAPSLLILLLLSPCAPADDYVVHEWGYFLENGDQDVLDFEANLPPEVPSFRNTREPEETAGTGSGRVTAESSGMATRPMAQERARLRAPLVTRVMADPYLHFYAEHPFEVDVRVEFPTGAPMFWWPVAEVGEDRLEWKRVAVGLGDVPLHRWGGSYRRRLGVERARRVASATLETAGTRDRYIFYDGTMSADSFVRRRSSWDGLHLSSASSEPVHDVLVFFEGASRPRYFERLAPGEEIVVTPETGTPIEFDETWLSAMLVRGGLRPDEAEAMSGSLLETGFFDTPGVEVLYRIGQDTYDRIFPLALEPAPREVVRVGVVLSYDLDHAIRAALARLETFRDRPDVVGAIRAELRRIVGGQVADLEPLSAAMRTALEVPDDGLARLTGLIRPSGEKAPTLAEIDALLGRLEDPAATADARREAAAELARKLRVHLYAGGEWSSAIADFMSRGVRSEEVIEALRLPSGIID